MRKLLLVLAVGLLAACNNTSAPPVYSLGGSWRGSGIDTLQLEMTITETARSAVGAGSWLTPTVARGFGVSGAHADTAVSLLLSFDGAPDVVFRGAFHADTLIAGGLYGDGLRGVPLDLVRTAAP